MLPGCQATEDPKSSGDRPLISLVTSFTEPDNAGPGHGLPSTPVARSLPLVSPTESNISSLFSPVDSVDSQDTATADSTDNNVSEPKNRKASFLKQDQELISASLARCRSPNSAVSSPSHKRLSSPDRFVPPRNPFYPTSVPFRLSKDPCLLSPNERLFRKRDQSVNPFILPPNQSAAELRQKEGSNCVTLPHNLSRYISGELLGDYSVNQSEVAGSRLNAAGALWSFEGRFAPRTEPQNVVSDGQGGLLGSGTVAPAYVADFLAKETPSQNAHAYESRLAVALDVDQSSRVLSLSIPPTDANMVSPVSNSNRSLVTWKDARWTKDSSITKAPRKVIKVSAASVPSTPFRVLDAPLLRDDFYCSALAYCPTTHVLAVGLGHRVYLWSETMRVRCPPLNTYPPSNHVTSLCFSSQEGAHSILAVGRHDGQITLWSTFDKEPRFHIKLPNPVSCLCYKSCTTRRASDRYDSLMVEMEDLVVGDDLGYIWYYSVEWSNAKIRKRHHWNGAMVLLARIEAHSQQICGMAWSPDGRYLATGGNDNVCFLFDMVDLFNSEHGHEKLSYNCVAPTDSVAGPCHVRGRLPHSTFSNQVSKPRQSLSVQLGKTVKSVLELPSSYSRRHQSASTSQTLVVPLNSQKHKFAHAAAVKAIAFSPWQPTLLATGGGTNDRCIRFYHTTSGACLATINVHAQVTSLIWSKTKREIAATFGYAQPEHPYRIAVFSWPSCQQVVAIPWSANNDSEGYGMSGDCGRALWAISYPGGPNGSSQDAPKPTTSQGPSGKDQTTSGHKKSHLSYKEGGTWWSRTAEEGCIVVASSDECVKFHEVWSGMPKNVNGGRGQLGCSDILECLEGIEKDMEVIR